MADHRLQIILAAKDITGTAFRKFRGSIAAMTRSVFSLQGAVGTLAGTAGIGYLVKSSLDAADAIGKAADVAGIHTGVLQEYQHAASLSGVSTELLNSSFLAFNKRLGEARSNTGPLVTFLKKFDEQLLDNIKSAGSTEAALKLVFDRMGQLTDAADRAALANAAFSRSGVKLTVMVKNGAAELNKMREEAHALGIVIDDDLIRGAEEANDKLGTLGKVLRMQVTGAIVKLAPKITEVSTNVLSWVDNNQQLIQQDIPGHLKKIADALADIAKYAALPSIYDTFTQGADLAAQGLIDWNKFVAASFLERQKMVDEAIRQMERLGVVTKKITQDTPGYAAYAGTAYTTGGGFGGEAPPAVKKDTPEFYFPPVPDLSGYERGRFAIGQSMADAQAEALAAMTKNHAEAYEAMDAHVQAYYDNVRIRNDQITAVIDNMADRMSAAIASFATTGQFNFKAFADAIIYDLIRIQTRTLLTSIFSKIAGSFAGYSAGGAAGGGFAFAGGGYIGENVVGVGMKSGKSYEFHGDEVVLPMGKLGAASGGGGNTYNVYNISAMDAPSFVDMMRRSGAVPMLAAENLSDNGLLRQAMLENT